MESIKLEVESPVEATSLSGLDALIGKLERVEELRAGLAKAGAVRLVIEAAGLEKLDAASNGVTRLQTALKAVGDTNWSAKLESGAATGRQAFEGIAMDAARANAELAAGIVKLGQLEVAYDQMGARRPFADKMAAARQALDAERAEVEKLREAAEAANRVEGAARGAGGPASVYTVQDGGGSASAPPAGTRGGGEASELGPAARQAVETAAISMAEQATIAVEKASGGHAAPPAPVKLEMPELQRLTGVLDVKLGELSTALTRGAGMMADGEARLRTSRLEVRTDPKTGQAVATRQSSEAATGAGEVTRVTRDLESGALRVVQTTNEAVRDMAAAMEKLPAELQQAVRTLATMKLSDARTAGVTPEMEARLREAGALPATGRVNAQFREAASYLPAEVQAKERLAAATESLAGADTRAAGAARASGGALDSQRTVVAAKIGVVEKLAVATERLAQADERSAEAAGASAGAEARAASGGLMLERTTTDQRGRERTTRRYRTGAGETRTETGESTTEETNAVAAYRTRFEKLDAEFAGRRAALAAAGNLAGSPAQIGLLDAEAEARRRIVTEMNRQGLAEESLALKQSARASQSEAQARTAEVRLANSERVSEAERRETEALRDALAQLDRQASVERGAAQTDEERIRTLRTQAEAYRELAASIREAGTEQPARGGLLRRVEGQGTRLGGEADNLAAQMRAEQARTAERAALIQADFERASQGMEIKKTASKTGPNGNEQTLVASREAENLREVVTLTQRWDAEGRALIPNLSQVATEVEHTGRGVASMDRSIFHNIGTITTWAAGAAVLYGSLRLLRDGVSAIPQAQLETAQLGNVFDTSAKEAAGLRDAVLAQAGALGQNGASALQAAREWRQLGATQADALGYTAEALKQANISETDALTITKALSPVVKDYGLSVAGLRAYLAELNATSASANIENKSLLEGVARVAPVARQAGLSLNEVTAQVATMSERTGKAGAQIGDVLRSLVLGFESPTLQKFLDKEFQFKVRTDTGDLKGMSQILDELFVKYQAMNKAERGELAVKTGGRRQAAALLAGLDGYVESQMRAIQASRQMGATDAENNRIRQTSVSQLATMEEEFQRIFVNLGNAGGGFGVTAQLTELARTIGNVLKVAANLGPALAVGVAILAVMAVRVARTALAMSEASGSGNLLTNSLRSLSNAWTQLGAAVAGTNAKLTTANQLMGTAAAKAEAGTVATGAAAVARSAAGPTAKGIGALVVGTVFSPEMAAALAGLVAIEAAMKGFNLLMDALGGGNETAADKTAKLNAELERTKALLDGTGTAARLAGTLSKALPDLAARDPDRAAGTVRDFAGQAYTEDQDPGGRRRQALRDELETQVRTGNVKEAQARLDAVALRLQRDKVTLAAQASAQNARAIDQQQTELSLLERQIALRRADRGDTADLEKQRLEATRKLSDLRGDAARHYASLGEEDEGGERGSDEGAAVKKRLEAHAKGIEEIYAAIPVDSQAGRVPALDREIEKLDARKALLEAQAEEDRRDAAAAQAAAQARVAAATQEVSGLAAVRQEHARLAQAAQDAAARQKEGVPWWTQISPDAGAPAPDTQSDLDERAAQARQRVEAFEREHGGQLDADAQAQQRLENAQAGVQTQHALNSAKQEEIEKNEKALAQEREGLQLQRERYAALRDALTQGARQGRIEAEGYGIGRNETERALNQAAAIGGLRRNRFTLDRDALGMVERGNIDLTQRPRATNPDGSISTVRSMSFEEDDPEYIRGRGSLRPPREVLVPTIRPDGLKMDNNEAIAWYRASGQHLGKFGSAAEADAYAQRLHEQQAREYDPAHPSAAENLGGLMADPARRYDAAVAKGDGVEQNRAAAEILQLNNRLTETQLSLEERRYRLQADIVNERRKENEEASKALVMAGREDQLRAALLAKYEQTNGRFTSAQFQFLDQSTKQAVTRYTPEAAPVEAGAGSRRVELEREAAEIAQTLGGFSRAVKETSDFVAKNIKVSAAPLPVGASAGGPPPPQVNPPSLTLTFGDQATALSSVVLAAVNSRLDAEFATIRTQIAVLARPRAGSVSVAQVPGQDATTAGN